MVDWSLDAEKRCHASSPACITVPENHPLWKDRPTWFLVAEQDRMIVQDTQRFMAERMHARVRSHPVDHTPIVTAPGLVVDVIREAMGEAISALTEPGGEKY
jgi:pimeloyl-ACP methyl ester carboxylesterase